ncbi:MAG: pyridoxamine 5'-phosphate oxidase family protein [Mariprofundaceae bacterium]
MSEDYQADIQSLLKQNNIGFLATSGEHGPETSMTPFTYDQHGLLLHLSTLARHTSNLTQSPQAGFMICTPESEADSPLALPRLSLNGRVEVLTAADVEQERACYLSRISDAAPLFEFADFQLYRFSISHIYWVGGFGSARKVPLNSWQKISTCK